MYLFYTGKNNFDVFQNIAKYFCVPFCCQDANRDLDASRKFVQQSAVARFFKAILLIKGIFLQVFCLIRI
jgi:hypothetical protein